MSVDIHLAEPFSGGKAGPAIQLVSQGGAVRFDAIVEAEDRALQWIPPTESVRVQGREIPGGVYLGSPQYFNFSFMVDPELPIGDAEKAGPVRWPFSYWHLTEHQRALFLRWLEDDLPPQLSKVNTTPYAQAFLSGLEWRLFVHGDPDGTLLAACERLALREDRKFQFHAANLLSWWGQSQDSQVQLVVIEEFIRAGFWEFPRDVLRLALANCASIGSPVSADIAAEVGLDQATKITGVHNLRPRLRRRLREIYPVGAPLPPAAQRVRISYSPACPELRTEGLVRQGAPIPCLELPDFSSELGARLRPIVSGLAMGPHFDPDFAATVAAQTKSTQAFLEREFPTTAEEIDPVTLPRSSAPLDLSDNYKAALGRILTRQTWSKADFANLAQEFRLMPSGLRIHLNRWAQEKFGDLLLDGTEPIQVNPYVIQEIERYL